MHVFAVIFKHYIDLIDSTTHNYCYKTRFVKGFNIMLPKLRTADFCQSGPYFVFMYFCINHIKFDFMILIILNN